MNEREYDELLRYLQQSVRRAGLGAFDERTMMRVNIDPGPARSQVLQYLRSLDASIRIENFA